MYRLATTIFICLACTTRGDLLDDDELLSCGDAEISFNFTNTKIQKLGEGFLQSNLISCLDFTDNQIQFIDPDAFKLLPNLTHLYLSGIDLPEQETLLWISNVPSLRVLYMDRVVKDIYRHGSARVIGGFPELRLLSLTENGIVSLEPNYRISRPYDLPPYDDTILYGDGSDNEASVFYPVLEYLDLSGNAITSVTSEFLLSKSLRYLNMSGNSIHTFHKPKMTNLETLVLDFNRIESIGLYWHNGGLLLSGYENLRFLSLKHNAIREIYLSAFSDSNKLEYLDMSNNDLGNDNMRMLEFLNNLMSVKILNLAASGIKIFPWITNDLSVETLDLGCNKLETLPTEAFKHMPLLKKLYLNDNQLRRIGKDNFASLSELNALHLDMNELSYFEDGWSASLKSLRYLNLSGNRLLTLESLFLSSTVPLLDLYLANNPLNAIKASSFDDMPQNVTVHLDPATVDARQCIRSETATYTY